MCCAGLGNVCAKLLERAADTNEFTGLPDGKFLEGHAARFIEGELDDVMAVRDVRVGKRDGRAAVAHGNLCLDRLAVVNVSEGDVVPVRAEGVGRDVAKRAHVGTLVRCRRVVVGSQARSRHEQVPHGDSGSSGAVERLVQKAVNGIVVLPDARLESGGPRGVRVVD